MNTKSSIRGRLLSIEVTTRCNSNCSHCFVRDRTRSDMSLPVHLVKELVSEGFHLSYRHLHMTGGEPLMWPGIFETLNFAFDQGYETAFINTNGMLMTKDLSRSLAAYPNLSISVSLDGPESIHDTMRGEGSYRKATAGIEYAIEAGVHVTVFTAVTRGLLPFVAYFANDVHDQFSGIERLTFIPLVEIGADDDGTILDLFKPQEFLHLVQTIAFLNLYGLRVDMLREPLVNVASKLLQMPWIPTAEPPYQQGSIIVLANGEISVTHSTGFRFGKYEPGIISSILSSDDYQAAVSPDNTECTRCEYSGLCSQNDVAGPSGLYSYINHGDPYCRSVLDCIQQQ